MYKQKVEMKLFFNQQQKTRIPFDKEKMEREMQIVTLANSEVKRRGFDESHEEFGEMVEDLVYRIHCAFFDYKKFQKVVNKWKKN